MSFSLKNFVTILLSIFSIFNVDSNIVVKGSLKDIETGFPVSRGIIKGKQAGKIITFTQSDNGGNFSIEIPDSIINSVEIEITCHGYKSLSTPASQIKHQNQILLEHNAQTLHEVTVTPKTVYEKVDTLTFNVDAVRNIGDRNIEDVIAHLPGISVSNGKISYNGEAINRFYIEGLDALGAEYYNASQNIRAEDVSTIELYENHEPTRVLQGQSLSKNAAINLRLKKQTLSKPSGHITVGIGKGSLRDYWLGKIFGMSISPLNQLYLKGGGNNFDISSTPSGSLPQGFRLPVSNLLNLSSIGSINIPSNLYNFSVSSDASSNFAFKSGKYAIFRGSFGYGHFNIKSSFHTLTSYHLPENSNKIEISQEENKRTRRNSLSFHTYYEYNSPSLYISDQLSGGVSTKRINSRINEIPGQNVNQSLKTNDIIFNNYFKCILKTENRLWESNANIDFHNIPLNNLSAIDEDNHIPIVQQSAHAMGLKIDASTEIGWNIGYSSIGVNLKMTDTYTAINTVGQIGNDLSEFGINTPKGNETAVKVGPTYTYRTPSVVFKSGIPFEVIYKSFQSLPDNSSLKRVSAHPAPFAYISLTLPKNIKGNMELNFSKSTDDIENYMTNPIATSYRTIYAPGTGIPFTSTLWSTGSLWSWRKIRYGFFSSISVNFTSFNTDRILNSSVDNNDESLNFINEKNRTNRLSSILSLSKLVMGQKGTLKLDISYQLSSSAMIRNSIKLPLKSSDVSTALSFDAPLFSNWLVVKPTAIASLTKQKSIHGFNRHQTTFRVSSPLIWMPFKNFDMSLIPDFRSNPVSESTRLNIFILNSNLRYKKNQWEIELHINNLTDRRVYSVETYNNMTYTLTQANLKGVEALISLKYNF